MKFAILGCGYVSDMYCQTLAAHPELHLVGAWDHDPARLSSFCARYASRAYDNFDQLLQDDAVPLVLNLTNPRSHHELNLRCLSAGKHVYSEKPLAMDASAARELVDVAAQQGVYLASAPCSVLSETAQTMWRALQQQSLGRVRLVYANFDDGLIAPRQEPWTWLNERGVAWPARDEFEVGCTYEHAGYVLSWLAAFFGPARRVTAFASCQIHDKGLPVDELAPDFTVGCIEYDAGIVARVTCGLVAPLDKSLTIVGDEGVLTTATVRRDAGPVYYRGIPAAPWVGKIERGLNRLRQGCEGWLPAVPWSGHDWHFSRRVPWARRPGRVFASRTKPVDFCRGPAELVAAITERRSCRLSAELGWHLVELIEALQYPERFGGCRQLASSFPPVQPLEWNC